MQEHTRKRKILRAIITLAIILGIAVIVLFAYHAGKAQNNENAKGIVVSEDATAWDKDLNNLSGEQQQEILKELDEVKQDLNTALK